MSKKSWTRALNGLLYIYIYIDMVWCPRKHCRLPARQLGDQNYWYLRDLFFPRPPVYAQGNGSLQFEVQRLLPVQFFLSMRQTRDGSAREDFFLATGKSEAWQSCSKHKLARSSLFRCYSLEAAVTKEKLWGFPLYLVYWTVAIIRSFRYYLPNRENSSSPKCLLQLILKVPLYIYLNKDLNCVAFAEAKLLVAWEP